MISNDIVQPLFEWYDANKRILPWRGSRDPYRIWVSEIMLQQTRVEAVKPYYDRFMDALPIVSDLADAQQEQLLKLWEGLGYYNRVRNMQKAARIIMQEYDGRMPDQYELLLRLPGIGSYTAGAVASIAFDRPCPAVDGNVLRIITRLSADDTNVLDVRFKKRVEAALAQIMPADRPGDFNQAMMELGATVCVPNGAPKCSVCPWRKMCRARALGLLDKIPHKEKKKARKIEKKTVLLMRDGDRTLIRRRQETGLLAGLYEFPTFEGWLDKEEIERRVSDFGYQPLFIRKLSDAKHIFTHKEWHMKGYLVKVADSDGQYQSQEKTQVQKENVSGNGGAAEIHLILPEEIETEYPIPSAYKAYTKYADIAIGNEHFLR